MKTVIFLLICLALSAAAGDNASVLTDDDVLEDLEAGTNAMFDWITNITETHLLNENGTDFQPVITGILGVIESQICPVKNNAKCSSSENWLFGCTCKKEFRALGKKCRKKPCQLFRHYKEKGPESLSSFIDTNSYKEKLEIIFNYAINPISRALCKCPEMIGASINCSRKYDGRLFEISRNVDRELFDRIVDNLDWNSVKIILDTLVSAGCGEKNGKDCVTENSNMWFQFGTMLDNTLNGEDSCKSMIRMNDTLVNFITTMASFNKNNTLKEMIYKYLNKTWWTEEGGLGVVSKYLEVFVDFEKELMCDPNCAGVMNDRFYSCCTKHLMEEVSSKSIRKTYLKLFKNIWSKVIMSEDPLPNLKSTLNKYLAVYDLDEMCGDMTDVYGVKNQMCDALEE